MRIFLKKQKKMADYIAQIKNENYTQDDIIFILNRHLDSISLLKIPGVIGMGTGVIWSAKKGFVDYAEEQLKIIGSEANFYTPEEVAIFTHNMFQEFQNESFNHKYEISDQNIVNKELQIINDFLNHKYVNADIDYSDVELVELSTPKEFFGEFS